MGITSLNQINETTVRQFLINGRANRNWSVHTFIQYHKTIKVFCDWCIQRGHLESNPVCNIETPKPEKRIPKGLSLKQANRLLEIVYNYPYKNEFYRKRNHAIFATLLYTGLRRNELINLKLTDVNIEQKTLFVRQGKGSKDRIIPLNYNLVDSLGKYIAERERYNKTCPEFFTSIVNNSGIGDQGLKRLIKKMRDVSKIKFSAHTLRHTFATLMLEGGCDIYSLSKLMGHSNISTTTIYLAATTQHLRSQITKHPLGFD